MMQSKVNAYVIFIVSVYGGGRIRCTELSMFEYVFGI